MGDRTVPDLHPKRRSTAGGRRLVHARILAGAAMLALLAASAPAVAANPEPAAHPMAEAAVPVGQPYIDDATSNWVDIIDYRHIVGQVVNDSAERIDFVEVDVTVYNASDQVVATDFTFTRLDSIAPGGSSSFELIFEDAPDHDHFTLTGTFSTPSEISVGGLTVLEGVPYTDGFGDRHYVGEIENSSAHAIEFTEAIVTLVDAGGTVLNTDFTFTNPDTLAPGAKAPYDVTFFDHYAGATRVVTQAQGWTATGFDYVTSWDNTFDDLYGSSFRADVIWLAESGITSGCSAHLYCPTSDVTRAQMGSFLARAMSLPASATDYFTDDNGTTHEANINRIAKAGITSGCAPSLYCPDDPVTRGQMASFLARALGLTAGGTIDYFTDDNGTTHETNINRLRHAAITYGCTATTYCPNANVTRGQMAAFLHRAFGP
jgi:hypothetical protein